MMLFILPLLLSWSSWSKLTFFHNSLLERSETDSALQSRNSAETDRVLPRRNSGSEAKLGRKCWKGDINILENLSYYLKIFEPGNHKYKVNPGKKQRTRGIDKISDLFKKIVFKALLAILVFLTLYYIYHYSSGAID